MREIRASHITDTVARLCVEANRQLPQDVRSRICAAYADECGETGYLRNAG